MIEYIISRPRTLPHPTEPGRSFRVRSRFSSCGFGAVLQAVARLRGMLLFSMFHGAEQYGNCSR